MVVSAHQQSGAEAVDAGYGAPTLTAIGTVEGLTLTEVDASGQNGSKVT